MGAPDLPSSPSTAVARGVPVQPSIVRAIDVDDRTAQALLDILYDTMVFRRLAVPGLLLLIVANVFVFGRGPLRSALNFALACSGLVMNRLVRRYIVRQARQLGLAPPATTAFLDVVTPALRKRPGRSWLERDDVQTQGLAAWHAGRPSLTAPPTPR